MKVGRAPGWVGSVSAFGSVAVCRIGGCGRVGTVLLAGGGPGECASVAGFGGLLDGLAAA